MFNKFKIGEKVIVNGIGEIDGKSYDNVTAIVLECDPHFKDFRVKFEDETEDWILPEDLKAYIEGEENEN